MPLRFFSKLMNSLENSLVGYGIGRFQTVLVLGIQDASAVYAELQQFAQ